MYEILLSKYVLLGNANFINNFLSQTGVLYNLIVQLVQTTGPKKQKYISWEDVYKDNNLD